LAALVKVIAAMLKAAMLKAEGRGNNSNDLDDRECPNRFGDCYKIDWERFGRSIMS
jgi:hypothetical protein